MVIEMYPSNTPPAIIPNQLGKLLKGERLAAGMTRRQAAAALNKTGYPTSPHPVTGEPIGKITAKNWRGFETGHDGPTNAGRLLENIQIPQWDMIQIIKV